LGHEGVQGGVKEDTRRRNAVEGWRRWGREEEMILYKTGWWKRLGTCLHSLVTADGI